MSDELLKRLQSRRSFLKGSALLAAAAVAAPAALSAQSQDQQAQPQGQNGQEKREGQDRQDGQDKQDGRDGKDTANDAPQQEAREGDGAKTFTDSSGRPYRVCPQCGSNMYKQGRTWTCENCGYSYDE